MLHLSRLLPLLMALILTACHQGTPWASKDITGLMPDLDFTLTEANRNAPVTAKDYRGQIVMMFFGYMHCPDVCPMTLTRLRAAIDALGKDADQVRVLFVSVDPKRDNLADLKKYTEFFGPDVLGLRGEQTALRSLTKRYRVTYGYDKPDASGNYEVSHSGAVYVFDRTGKARLLMRPSDRTVAITTDLKRLVGEK